VPIVIALLLMATATSGYVLWKEEACERPAAAGRAAKLPGMLALM
jgi:hypothetical protein